MVLRLFNTLTRDKEEFKPVYAGEARLYHCGPTVYNFAHIGNLRAYVFADILRRTLEYNGYKIKQVINITDIGHLASDADDGEDKMVKALRREGKPLTLEAMKEVAEKYETAFRADLRKLNIKTDGTQFPRASEHISEDIELIQRLEAGGFAYKTGDGIYFDTAMAPEYGKLGNVNLEGLRAGARVTARAGKRNPTDFALWKFVSGGLPSFGSPFGPGFPGWHIECSAMSRKYLGQPFDIHTGGVDHIGTHHNNEIAQSEAAYGFPLANYWLHSEFMNVAGEKMAKSEENFLTLRALAEKGVNPLSYRYYLLQTHYRSPLAFSWDALAGAQTAYLKLLAAFSHLEKTPQQSSGQAESIQDDLNTPTLLARLWEFMKEKNRNAVLDADKILGLDIENQSRRIAEEAQAVPEKIKEPAARREAARLAKDFALADALRAEILAAGYEILDTDSGPIIRKKIK